MTLVLPRHAGDGGPDAGAPPCATVLPVRHVVSQEGRAAKARVVMSVSAYILIQTEVGKAAEVARTISGLAGVTSAEDVTGPYDVVVRAEADSVNELGRLVVANVQGVPGITRTVTCPVVEF
jgi:DNA-binding Lrp family transcriptional regulator